METVFYFVPHQDDELTNFGPAICRDLSAGHSVFVVLCTDGAASGVKRMLCDGGACRWHAGAHRFALDAAAFTAARDREYIASCRAMGVAQDHILISPIRAADGQLSRQPAQQIILESVAPFGACRVCTLLPVYDCHQNPDHTALGEAALALHRAGRIAAPDLLFEPLLLPESRAGADAEKIVPTPEERARLLLAAGAYRQWAPERGRYAVGYHSVADEFDAFCADPFSLRLPAR